MIIGKEIFADAERIHADYLGKFGEISALPPCSSEIAFIGRSNSGKSSLLKALLNTEKTPQVSARPGSTRLIHVYKLVGKGVHLADFPGYGYAQSSKDFRARFSQMLVHYLASNRTIRALFLTMDARRKIEDEELEIARIASEKRISLILCLNKADRLNQSERERLKAAYKATKPFFEIVLISAQKRHNLGYLRQFIGSLA